MNKIIRSFIAVAAIVPAVASAQDLPATPLNFSGVLFANYQYHNEQGMKAFNKFDLERAYLTFKLATSENTQIRVTTDVYNSFGGWAVRAKYAYLQYAYYTDITGITSTAQVGIVPTAFVTYEENFWPRWLSPTVTDRTGINPSADVGIDNVVTFPGKLGELYASITNGNGYTFSETDRFKEYAARFTFTPLANGEGKLKTLSLTAWGALGDRASKFVNEGIGTGVKRDRFGLFAGIRDSNLVLAGDWVTTKYGGEQGTATSPMPYDSTGTALSAYTVLKPFGLMKSETAKPLGIVLRWDKVKGNKDIDRYYQYVVAGLTWDLNPKTAFSLDYQEQLPKNGAPYGPLKAYYFHVRADF